MQGEDFEQERLGKACAAGRAVLHRNLDSDLRRGQAVRGEIKGCMTGHPRLQDPPVRAGQRAWRRHQNLGRTDEDSPIAQHARGTHYAKMQPVEQVGVIGRAVLS